MWRLACRLVITATKGTENFLCCVKASNHRLDYPTAKATSSLRDRKIMENFDWIAFFDVYENTHRYKSINLKIFIIYCVFCGCVLDGLDMQNLPLLGPQELMIRLFVEEMCTSTSHGKHICRKCCRCRIVLELTLA